MKEGDTGQEVVASQMENYNGTENQYINQE